LLKRPKDPSDGPIVCYTVSLQYLNVYPGMAAGIDNNSMPPPCSSKRVVHTSGSFPLL
jgi:hypothetical protein